MSGNGTGATGQKQDRPAARGAPDLEFFPGNALLDAGTEGFGARFFGGKTRGKTFRGAGSGAAVGYFRFGKHAIEESIAVALHGASDTRHFNEVDPGADQHEATVAQGETFSSGPVQIALKSCPRVSDADNVRDIAEQNREQRGWELNLTALCAEDAARTVRFLTGAVMACGGFVLSRRFDANESAAIEFEFVRATCVEMYSVLIASGLELTAQSHLIMSSLCQCTRETLEATAGDPVRVDLMIRRTGTLPRCEPGGSMAPPQMA